MYEARSHNLNINYFPMLVAFLFVVILFCPTNRSFRKFHFFCIYSNFDICYFPLTFSLPSQHAPVHGRLVMPGRSRIFDRIFVNSMPWKGFVNESLIISCVGQKLPSHHLFYSCLSGKSILYPDALFCCYWSFLHSQSTGS